LFTYSRFDAFISCRLIDSVSDRIRNVRLLLNDLPSSHKATLASIVKFLKLVSSPEHAANNGCTVSSLAALFGPEMLRPLPLESETLSLNESHLSSVSDAVSILELFIEHADDVSSDLSQICIFSS
jgi:hypothetical protein